MKLYSNGFLRGILPTRTSAVHKASRRIAAGLLCLLVCSLVTTSLTAADDRYIGVGQPDGRVLLPPPPVPGSTEAEVDLATSRSVFKGRTAAEEARAITDATLAFTLFAPVIGPVFDLEKLPKTDAFLQKVKKEVAETINFPKDFWQRKRPYQVDPSLTFGRPERSTSYPSGHSMRGTLYALLMVELFGTDENREKILEIGRNIGWDRVLIGKHFYTDVLAGRALAYATMHELKANEAFQRDLAAARAEIAAARAAGK